MQRTTDLPLQGFRTKLVAGNNANKPQQIRLLAYRQPAPQQLQIPGSLYGTPVPGRRRLRRRFSVRLNLRSTAYLKLMPRGLMSRSSAGLLVGVSAVLALIQDLPARVLAPTWTLLPNPRLNANARPADGLYRSTTFLTRPSSVLGLVPINATPRACLPF